MRTSCVCVLHVCPGKSPRASYAPTRLHIWSECISVHSLLPGSSECHLPHPCFPFFFLLPLFKQPVVAPNCHQGSQNSSFAPAGVGKGNRMTPSISFPRLKAGLEPRAKAREAPFFPGHLYAAPIRKQREAPKCGSRVAPTYGQPPSFWGWPGGETLACFSSHQTNCRGLIVNQRRVSVI